MKHKKTTFILQLFSRSTAIGLRVYREEGTDGFQDTAETEAFTQMINDVFDSLNAKLPKEGIRANSPKIQVSNTFKPWFIRLFFRLNCLCGIIFLELIHFNDVAFCISLNFSQVIKDFLVMLDTTEFNHNTKNTLLFASRQTTESLRVTLLSIIDIIDELHKAGVPYVLTAKLNQDPLEVMCPGPLYHMESTQIFNVKKCAKMLSFTKCVNLASCTKYHGVGRIFLPLHRRVRGRGREEGKCWCGLRLGKGAPLLQYTRANSLVYTGHTEMCLMRSFFVCADSFRNRLMAF